MKTIILYHGSLNKIEKFKDNVSCGGFYCTENINEANEYVVSQGNNELGEYGYIYKVEIPFSDIIETDDIDQSEKSNKVLFSKEEGYYRIDICSNYKIIEMSDIEIQKIIS